MKKDLFSDLTVGNDKFSQKYQQKNNEYELQEKIKSIDELIIVFSDDEKNIEWANSILSLYNQNKGNKEIFSNLKYIKLFENLKEDAEIILKEHHEQLESEQKERERMLLLEQERLERDEILKQELLERQRLENENNNLNIAREIDEKITKLIIADRDKSWCKDVEKLYQSVESLKFEQRKNCKKLEDLENLKYETKYVIKANIIDDKILKFQTEPKRDEIWKHKVLGLRDERFDEVIKYIKRIDVYKQLVSEIDRDSKIIEQKSLESDKKNTVDFEDIFLQTEITKQIEKLKNVEQDILKQEELLLQKPKEIKKQSEDAGVTGSKRESLINEFLSLSSNEKHPFIYKVEDEKIVLDYAKTNIIDCEVPFGVEVINVTAFASQKKLRSIKLPDTIQEIKEMAFYRCKSLVKIEIPSKVTTIKDRCFEECSNLQKVVANGVVDVKENAFKECRNLTTLEMKNLEQYDYHNDSFSGCVKLKTLECGNSRTEERIIATIPGNKVYKKYLNSLIKLK